MRRIQILSSKLNIVFLVNGYKSYWLKLWSIYKSWFTECEERNRGKLISSSPNLLIIGGIAHTYTSGSLCIHKEKTVETKTLEKFAVALFYIFEHYWRKEKTSSQILCDIGWNRYPVYTQSVFWISLQQFYHENSPRKSREYVTLVTKISCNDITTSKFL